MAKRDLILHNFWWKVTSLLLAVIVWMVVNGSAQGPDSRPRTTRTFANHTLSIMRDATDKRPIRITPSEVDVVVSAPIMEATRLSDSDIQTFIDLADVTERNGKVRIRVFVPASRGVQLDSITPTEVTIEILE